MQINVSYLENLKLEAYFDDFKVLSDQPIRYKGDGSAPGPFDYFLASSAMCAAYFVKLYCNSRNIPTDDIRVSQDNIVDPDNRYKQTFRIQVEIPESISEKDREGIIKSIDRCTVKKTIQASPDFIIEATTTLSKDNNDELFSEFLKVDKETNIIGKDSSLEDSIRKMTGILHELGIKIEISSWRNPIPGVWSVHIRDADSPICFTNGKGATKSAAICSALGEFLERLSSNYFYADYYLGQEIAEYDFVHYKDEKWFDLPNDDSLPEGILDQTLKEFYNPDGELKASHLIDTNSGLIEKGICSLPFIRQSDLERIYIPVNIIGNLYVSNGMSAGNSIAEARVQCLSEIFERAIKNKIISQQITLPDVPEEILNLYPKIKEAIEVLEQKGYPVVVKDASLGGRFPVMSVTLKNPLTGGVFASFGAHPKFEVALERSLTELLQGRSFEGLNDVPAPTFNEFAITEHNNIIDHFIDSTGVISWKFFSEEKDYDFVHWNFSGSTTEEFNYLMKILNQEGKEVYIADYQHLGFPSCRIIVPDYSEIYPVEDLIWDNNNQALLYREKVLQIHNLDQIELRELRENLEESGLDNYMPLSELIGIAFDENSTWGELVIGELKALIDLAIGDHEMAKDSVDLLHTFNEVNPERRKYYQLLSALLDLHLMELSQENYLKSFQRMYGTELVENAVKTIKQELKFFGLEQTDLNLSGLDKHLKLIDSYKKLHKAKKI